MNNKELLQQGNHARSVSWEILKALAIQMMTAAMTGFSHEVVWRWALSLRTSVAYLSIQAHLITLRMTTNLKELKSE